MCWLRFVRNCPNDASMARATLYTTQLESGEMSRRCSNVYEDPPVELNARRPHSCLYIYIMVCIQDCTNLHNVYVSSPIWEIADQGNRNSHFTNGVETTFVLGGFLLYHDVFHIDLK